LSAAINAAMSVAELSAGKNNATPSGNRTAGPKLAGEFVGRTSRNAGFASAAAVGSRTSPRSTRAGGKTPAA